MHVRCKECGIMRNKIYSAGLLFLVSVSAIASGCGSKPSPSVETGVSAEQQRADAAGFQEFSDRVKDYVKLHNSQEAVIPAVKATDLPEMINAHQQALARSEERRVGKECRFRWAP